VIVERAGRAIRRFWRAASPPVVAEMPPRRWADELSEAGHTPTGWLSGRHGESRLFCDISSDRLDALRAAQPGLVSATIDAASRVLRHEFDLLGSGPYTPIDPARPVDAAGYHPIDWQLDPVSALRFPSPIPVGEWNLDRMRPGRADVKLPWELGRCQHWPLLGQAYRLTRDNRFANEIAKELHDFMAANPVGMSVNWTCTMDVGLRAANWAIAFELIRSCDALPPEFWHDAYEALFDHGVFIEGHLENKYEVTSNHFLSNVVGLFYVAAIFRDLPRGRAWDRQCREWLAQEMDVQVLPDGADYESSVPYHRLVAELFLGAACVARHGGRPLPPAMIQRLRTMVDFLAAVTRPDGLMPQVGDADDGRLHVLSGYGSWNPQDPRHLFAAALSVFDDAAGLWPAYEWSEWEAAWWGAASETSFSRQSAPAARLRQFPDAGLVVARDGGDYLLITNGRVGTNGFGNHKHNDLLGFEWHMGGAPVLVDPGSYVYTSDPEARNRFRSTASHNTVTIDGEEQNEFKPEWLFRMFEKAVPEHVSLSESAHGVEYRGRHNGYARLPEPVIHERIFTWSSRPSALRVADRFDGRGTHRLRWHFHFAPGVTVEQGAPGRFVIALPGSSQPLRMIPPPGLCPSITQAWYSPSYGVRHRCVALDLDLEARVDSNKVFVFEIGL
jgi:hypothetical protein